jgi:probable phosphoglycerate mutase
MPIYFIRHGESRANKDGFLAGQMDVEITETGIVQAKTAGDRLKASNFKIDKIISSPLKRAYDTAKQIARATAYPLEHITLDPDLMERNMGFLQGEPVSMVSLLDTMSEAEKRIKGVETESMLNVRAKRILSSLEKYSGQNVLLVSHNGFGRRLIGVVHGVDFHKTKKIPNAQTVNLADDSLLIDNEDI